MTDMEWLSRNPFAFAFLTEELRLDVNVCTCAYADTPHPHVTTTDTRTGEETHRSLSTLPVTLSALFKLAQLLEISGQAESWDMVAALCSWRAKWQADTGKSGTYAPVGTRFN